MIHAQHCTGDCLGDHAYCAGFRPERRDRGGEREMDRFLQQGLISPASRSSTTEDATAFPPGSGLVKGRAAIEALWKSMAEQVSDPKLTTPRRQATRALGGARDRELQPQDQGADSSAHA
jgi:hypothetical protein